LKKEELNKEEMVHTEVSKENEVEKKTKDNRRKIKNNNNNTNSIAVESNKRFKELNLEKDIILNGSLNKSKIKTNSKDNKSNNKSTNTKTVQEHKNNIQKDSKNDKNKVDKGKQMSLNAENIMYLKSVKNNEQLSNILKKLINNQLKNKNNKQTKQIKEIKENIAKKANNKVIPSEESLSENVI